MAEQSNEILDPILRTTLGYLNESRDAKTKSMDETTRNFDCYHMRQDWSFKNEGMSTEFLPKLFIAVEQLTSFIQQGLYDESGFYRVELTHGAKKIQEKLGPGFLLTEKVAKMLMDRQFKKAKFPEKIADSIKMGLLGSLCILKIGGKRVPKIRFEVGEERTETGIRRKLTRHEHYVWELDLGIIRHEDYFPDPTGRGLYEGTRIEMDLHELIKTAELNPDDGYDLKQIEALQEVVYGDQEAKKARETDQSTGHRNARKKIQLYEFYGTLLDPDTGRIMRDKGVVMENVVWTIANDRFVIRKPKKNRLWHGKTPLVVAPIIRVPGSVWHKALMSASRDLNFAVNELFNLILDGGIMMVHGVKQVKTHLLENPEEISKGIKAGASYEVSPQTRPGEKVIETVATGEVPHQATNILAALDREFQQSSLSSDMRTGTLPQRQVKATEIVSAQQGLTSLFRGVVKILEAMFVLEVVEKVWLTIAQFMDDLDDDEIEAVIGPDEARALSQQSQRDRFYQAASGFKFDVFGMSSILNKMNDFRKMTAFLQTISGSEALLGEALQQISLAKLITEILKSLDLPLEKLRVDPGERERVMQEAAAREQPAAVDQTQIPQAGTTRPETEAQPPRSEILSGGLTTPGG